MRGNDRRCERAAGKLAPALAWALSCVAAVSCGAAHAQSRELGPRDFNIDLVTGPIIGANSTLALGGAYTALGFGIDAASLTPAAYATRTLWETNWFELDVTAGYSPGAFQTTDFDNNGEAGFSYRDYYSITGGARFSFGEIGFGGLVRAQSYRVGARASVSLIIANYGTGYALLDGQLLVAAAARTVVLAIDQLGTERTLAQFGGTGPELGVVLAPADQPYRIGFAARTAIEANETDTIGAAGGFMFPRNLILPTELQVGVAYQFGPRPLNRRWTNPHDVADDLRAAMLARRELRQRDQVTRERAAHRLRHSLDTAPPLTAAEVDDAADVLPRDLEFWEHEARFRPAEELELEREIERAQAALVREVRSLSRRYLMLSLDAILIAPVGDGIGFESFLKQRREASGREMSVGVRFGAEGEPIENRLKLRVGSYLEPSRFAAGNARLHATLGSDVKLFSWDVFGIIDPIELRVGAAVDVAVRYINYGISVGIWN